MQRFSPILAYNKIDLFMNNSANREILRSDTKGITYEFR
jgi:hypothetical protein